VTHKTSLTPPHFTVSGHVIMS